jgi:uncharacterized protein
MFDFLSHPWPWYIAGPILGSMVPLLLLIGNKTFGISSTLRQICAATIPMNVPFLKYNWKAESWNILFAVGIVIGAFLATHFFSQPDQTSVSEQTFTTLQSMGVEGTEGFVPADIFNWTNLLTLQGFCFMILGGFLIGFGTRYAGGCTSGHGLTGTALLQPASFVALIAFFAGGLASTYLLLPLLLRL